MKLTEMIALSKGAHTPCLIVGWEGACDECIDIMNKAFFEVHENAMHSSEDLVVSVTKDQEGWK